MIPIIARWLTTTLAILAVPYLISGVHVSGFGAALAAAAVLGALNALARPILILLTLPLTVLSLGFFLLIINALLFELASYLVSGVEIDSFGAAFLASLMVTVISWMMQAPWRGPKIVVKRGGEAWSPPTDRDGSTIDLDRDESGKWR
jgi:putative membrane protein